MPIEEKKSPAGKSGTIAVIGRRASLLVVVLFVLLVPGRAVAAIVTWDGGCGADPDWSCAANWSGDIAPGPADTVVFNAGASEVDPSFGGRIGALRLNAKFAGTLTLTRSLTVTKAISQLGGTFTAGEQALVAKALTVGGGFFTASSSVTEVDGSLKVTASGHLDANGGTFVLGGAGGSLNCGGAVFNRVVFANATGTKTVGASCTLPLGENPSAAAGGSIKLNGTLVGGGTLTTSGTLTLGETGNLSGLSGLVANSLAVAGAHGFGSYAPFSVAKNFALNAGGSFTAPSATASFAANFTIKSGATFDANGGAILFDGTANGRLECAGQTFHLVRFVHTAGRKVVAADCSLPLGNDPTLGAADGSVMLDGTLSGSGTLTTGERFALNGAASLSGFDEFLATDSLYLNGAVADFGSYSRFEVAKSYVQAGGTVTVPAGAAFHGEFALEPESTFNAPASGSVSFAERFGVSARATFNAHASTTVFEGTASVQIACGATAFHLVVFSHSAGTKTVGGTCDLPLGSNPETATGGSIALSGRLSGSGALATPGSTLTLEEGSSLSGFTGLRAENLTVNTGADFGPYGEFAVSGNLTIGTSGSLIAPSGTATIGGNFVNGGEFTANKGTVVLSGANQALSGNTTFYKLTKVAGDSATLTFAAGDTVTIDSKLTLLGAGSGKLLKLASSASGKAWRIDPRGDVEVLFLSVSDSTNLAAPIVAGESFNGGGNIGWIISGPVAYFLLTAQTTTPTAGSPDNLTITAKDAYGNTATSYTGAHSLTFGPVSDSPSGAHATVSDQSGTAVNFGTATPISFASGIATPSGSKNGAMTLVKAGSASLTVSDGSISNGTGLAVSVSPGPATRLAWTNAKVSKGTLSSPCLFACTGTELTSSGNFKANVSVTDSSGNTVSALGSGHTVSVTTNTGTIAGGSLTIASSGSAESTAQFTFTPPSKGGASTLTAATASGTVYTSATASMSR